MNQSRPVKAILVHGNGGCTAGDIWLPWLARELTTLGLDVTNETFPDNIKARAQFWLPHLEKLGADERTILIGHSSGAFELTDPGHFVDAREFPEIVDLVRRKLEW